MIKSEFYLSPLWSENFPEISAGFTLKKLGNMALTKKSISSNMSTCDNRQRIADITGFTGKNMFSPHQIHSDDIVEVNLKNRGHGAFGLRDSDMGDGCFTKLSDTLLITSWADCVGVILYAPSISYCASLHSGWKGAYKKISTKMIDILKSKGANFTDIYAAIGPSIKNCCYEVGKSFYDYFSDDIYRDCFNNKNNKVYFNLSYAVYKELVSAGLHAKNIDFSIHCTCCSKEPVFSSYRREGINFEGQAAFIGIKK